MAEYRHSGKKRKQNKNTILVAYRYRLYPDKEQEQYFMKVFGCVRFYWNKALEIKLKALEEKQEIPIVTPAQLKKEYPFLKEVDSLALSNAQLSLEKAFSAWFQKKSKKPKFKRKKDVQSYTTNNLGQIKIDFDNNTIKLPKLKKPVKIKLHRRFNGKIKNVTITMTRSGKYYASVLVEEPLETIPKLPEPVSKVCGIDLGIKDYAIIANDNGVKKIQHPHWIRETEKKIAKLQKQLARKKGFRKGEKKSKRFLKTAKKLAKLYEKLSNQRRDFLHKLSLHLIRENQTVVVEDLNIKGMLSNSRLAKHISDSSWHLFVSFLDYKAKRYGRTLIRVPRNFPSTKLCSVCGYKNDNLTLADRKWVCPICKTEHDRDVNASINLYLYGFTHLTGGRAGLARTQARGECSAGGTGICPVYEASLCEAGSSILYRVE